MELRAKFHLLVFPLMASVALGQLAAPNAAGVRLGHIHLAVKDVAVQERFWTETVGGTIVKKGTLSLIQLPGMYVMLQRAEPSAPPAGGIVNHFGFVWKDLPSALAKWKAAGVQIEQGNNPNQGYIVGPDGIRIEFFDDPAIHSPMEMNHIHFDASSEVSAMQTWYQQVFGGEPGKRPRVSTPGWTDCVFFGGANLSFSKLTQIEKPQPTKGRSLDHIGFDVTNMDQFAKKLDGLGLKFDSAPQTIPNTTVKAAFLTDPWGVYIEVTENLVPAK